MQKNVDATQIATVLAGYPSTKPKKLNISKLYNFVKQTKQDETKTR